jgi:DNA repair protein RecN (Recombination protein N)
MLESLTIDNLILIDHSTIEFDKRLNIITGETGAGKTSMTQALAMLLGERKDLSLIRKGKNKARMEAIFDVSSFHNIAEDLDSLGIDFTDDSSLILTRELTIDGKSRCFINRQIVPLTALQKIGSKLIQIISQHSYHSLRSVSAQRELLDQFGGHKKELIEFTSAFFSCKTIEETLQNLEEEKKKKERDIEHIEQKIDELISAHLQEEEEESLFQEYSLLSKSSQIQEKLNLALTLLIERERPLIKDLFSIKNHLEYVARQSNHFDGALTMIETAIVNLKELEASIEDHLHQTQEDPGRLQIIENRLGLYQKIKKKYGPTYKDWMEHLEELTKTKKLWENLDEKIEQLSVEHIEAKKRLDECGLLLSSKRAEAANELSLKLTSSINELNMPSSLLSINITKEKRTEYGDDCVEFWIQANKGENPSSIKEHSSGGELSRLLLAIKTVLAEKNDTPTLVFDEIDANVGGTTATLMAEKLKSLSQSRQVLCITHFPQMAKHADLHLSVKKIENEERTIATVEALDKEQRQKELERMHGITP